VRVGSKVPSESRLDEVSNLDDELDAIVKSVSNGEVTTLKKLQFQAYCAAISHED
jgi:hypothetical protein